MKMGKKYVVSIQHVWSFTFREGLERSLWERRQWRERKKL